VERALGLGDKPPDESNRFHGVPQNNCFAARPNISFFLFVSFLQQWIHGMSFFYWVWLKLYSGSLFFQQWIHGMSFFYWVWLKFNSGSRYSCIFPRVFELQKSRLVFQLPHMEG
jgi:hypothetical protein